MTEKTENSDPQPVTDRNGNLVYDSVFYTYNELANVIIFARFYLIIRYLFLSSPFYTNRAKRI